MTICVKCQRIYVVKKNAVAFEEGRVVHHLDLETNIDATLEPYKLWMGDLWACPSCGHEVIVGVPQHPLAVHYQPSYSDSVEIFKPILRAV